MIFTVFLLVPCIYSYVYYDFFQTGKVEVVTEDAVTALKKAAKWAQSGLVFSTGPPVDITPPEATNGDKKKQNSVTICREKNNELARYDISVWETIFFKHLPKWRVD